METTRQTFVRLLRHRRGGFVEFEYAIGDPDLAVELIMPVAAFEEFCKAQGARRLDGPDERHASEDGLGWNLHSATTRRFRDPS